MHLSFSRAGRRQTPADLGRIGGQLLDPQTTAACVVTLVDRLIHRSEIVQLDGESYRLREAKEQGAKRSKARSRRTAKSRTSRGTRS